MNISKELIKAKDKLQDALERYTKSKHDLKVAEAELYLKLRGDQSKKRTEKEIEATMRLDLEPLYAKVATDELAYRQASLDYDTLKVLAEVNGESA